MCVVGPSGSGKSSFCDALAQTYRHHGKAVRLVNMDPGNEQPLYACDADVAELVRVGEVERELQLGPNAALLHAFSFVTENAEWLLGQVRAGPDCCFILDFPGQIEIFSNTRAAPQLLQRLAREADLLVVQLYDSHFCSLRSL